MLVASSKAEKIIDVGDRWTVLHTPEIQTSCSTLSLSGKLRVVLVNCCHYCRLYTSDLLRNELMAADVF